VEIDEFSASPQINQYERGKHLPDLDTAKRLADALNVPMAYLYCPEEDLAEILIRAHELPAKKRGKILEAINQAGT
jgi:transcriptional regulator with XRE-family HTH domain